MNYTIIKELYHRAINNKTFINGSLFSIFSFVGQGVSFLLLILLANYILPEEYGFLSLFTTIVSLIGFVMAFACKGYSSITFFKSDSNDFKKDFTATIVLGIVSTAILAFPLCFVGAELAEKLSLSEDLLWYALIISFFTFTFQHQQDYLRIKERIKGYGIFNCGYAITNLVLSIVLVIAFHQSWMGRVNAWLISTALFGIISVIFFYRNDLIQWDTRWERYKKMLLWGIPMIPHAATDWIRQGADTYIINFYHSTYDVGIFNFALNLSNIIIMIGMAFNSTNSVTLYQILSNNNLSNVQKKISLSKQGRTILIINITTAAVIILSMTLLTHIALPKYNESIPLMWILSINGLAKCVYFLFCNYLFYYNKTKTLMYITFGTALIHFLLSFALTRFSLLYTAFIYGFMMIITAILVMVQARKLLRIHLSN